MPGPLRRSNDFALRFSPGRIDPDAHIHTRDFFYSHTRSMEYSPRTVPAIIRLLINRHPRRMQAAEPPTLPWVPSLRPHTPHTADISFFQSRGAYSAAPPHRHPTVFRLSAWPRSPLLPSMTRCFSMREAYGRYRQSHLFYSPYGYAVPGKTPKDPPASVCRIPRSTRPASPTQTILFSHRRDIPQLYS